MGRAEDGLCGGQRRLNLRDFTGPLLPYCGLWLRRCGSLQTWRKPDFPRADDVATGAVTIMTLMLAVTLIHGLCRCRHHDGRLL